MGVAERLAERGLEIPPAQVVPAGVRLTYRRLVRSGDVAYIAGHGPTHGDGWGSPLGQVGREVTVEQAIEAAELINGFSDLILDLYGEERLAARTSIGVPHLPFGMPVEVDAIIALS